MTHVKVCGITNLPDAVSAVLLGAEYVGFLVEINFAKDNLKREVAKDIIEKLPLEVKPVYVTFEKKSKKIIEIAKEISPKLIQLHNDITIEEIKKIKKAIKKVELIKTITVDNETAINQAKEYESIVDYLLLDTKKNKNTKKTKTHNWDISKKIVKLSKKPVFLAGGLNPDNVIESIKKVQPYAVDVNSGIESEPRKKDDDLMKDFIKKARK